ncbi:MAG TPA: hypothetical protein VJK49_04805 [Candidatus Limnocylindrales bacterium]|nr:hypothetical protein [Candidatus Limnocylindrales bacterium]
MRARSDASQQIAAAALARVEDPPGSGRVRVEDYLAALGAVTGEAAIVAAGLDIEALDMPPGSALFGDQINQVMTGDTADLAAVPADTIVGILVAELVPKSYQLADFGSLEDLYRSVAASVGQTEWGTVHLSVGADHVPSTPPIRLAFELRPAVEAACSAAGVPNGSRHVPCALALANGLEQVREAIDPKVGLTLALEVVFGMAKMAPMSRRAFDEVARQKDA